MSREGADPDRPRCKTEGMNTDTFHVIDDPARARMLVDGGAVLERHSLRMVLDLTRPVGIVEPVASVAIEPISIARLHDYASVMCRAYAGDHPDHEPGDDDPSVAAAVLDGYLRGDDLGPLIGTASMQAATSAGEVIGAIIVSEFAPGNAAPRGPWVTDLFVDPSWAGRGIGAAIVVRSVAELAERGDRALGLAVTVGNPAQRLYDRLGFTVVHELWRFAAIDV